MAEAFDPYHIWLAIPPEDQPADHYRLLGVKAFETNPDVLESAADQRMSHVPLFRAASTRPNRRSCSTNWPPPDCAC